MYHKRFGRRYFVVPIVLIACVAVLEASAVIETIAKPSVRIWPETLNFNATALGALAGAYMWVVSDFIGRARRTDFAPASVLWGTVRLFIAVPMGVAIGSIVKPDVVAFVAFGVGAFPLEEIQSFLRQLSAKALNINLGTVQNSQLMQLDGVDQALVDRLGQEDITSVAQLAYCDPVQLTMRSNLTFNAVVDLVSQALAWIYLQDKLAALRSIGLRGAYEIRQFRNDLDTAAPALDQQNAQRLVPEIARRLGLDPTTMWFMINAISDDPYTEFMYTTWN